MKKHIVIGIEQADGSIIPLPEMGVHNAFTIGLTPAHIHQRKIKLSFLSLSEHDNKQKIDTVSFKINKNTIQEDGSLNLHCKYIKKKVCVSLVDAHGEKIPSAMFRPTGKSNAVQIFKIAVAAVYSTAIMLLVLYIAERTIPSVEIFSLIGLTLPF